MIKWSGKGLDRWVTIKAGDAQDGFYAHLPVYPVLCMALVLAILLGSTTGCGEAVSVQRPTDAIEAAGFTEVRIVGKHGMAPTFYGCGEDDAVAFDAEATNPTGKRVKITACCGLVFKGCTLRH